jgi:hypothetical protein
MSLRGNVGSAAVLVMLAAAGGCTQVPVIAYEEEGVRIVDVVQRVKCEIYHALTVPISTRHGVVMLPVSKKRGFEWLKDWTAQVDLNLIVSNQSGVAPGLSFITPLANAHTVAQSFTAGVGGGASTTAARTETITFSLSVAEIQQEFTDDVRRRKLYRDCDFPSGGDLEADHLQLKEWIWSTLLPVGETYLSVGHHKSPKGGASAVGQKSASALKFPTALLSIKFNFEEKAAPSATVVALQQAASEVAGVSAELKTVGTEPSGPVLAKINRDIASAIEKIDAALVLLAAHQNDPDVIAYAKTIQFPTVKALQDHLDITRIDLKWGREFNILSQALNTPRSTIEKLSKMLDEDMVKLLNFPQNPETKDVYAVLNTAKQELKVALAAFDPPIDSISHQVQFVLSWNASASPSWSLVRFKGPTGTGAFASASRSDTHTLSIVMGTPGPSTDSKIAAIQIGNSITSTLGATPLRITTSP